MIISVSNHWRVLALALSFCAFSARAQLAPMGDHYGGRPSDTGFAWSGVSAGGDYTASIPLDLPASRHDMPVPIQISSGGHQVGAAGLGFDVPLSYVLSDQTWAHSRPAALADVAPTARERVTLALLGRTFELVKHGERWVSQRGAPDLSGARIASGWLLYDSDGRTYQFTSPGTLAGTNLFLLTAIEGPGGGKVQLDYDIGTPTLPGGSGLSIDLVSVSYNWHPTQGCFKNQVALTYEPARVTPLSYSMLADKVVARMGVLLDVDVLARDASCGDSLERLRRYQLNYQSDADTTQPQLLSVNVLGRQGTSEENTALPLISFKWGTATAGGALHYQKMQTVLLPVGSDPAKISATAIDSSVTMPGAGVPYATWQSLTDVTGDGRPDLVFSKNGKMWLAPNRPGPNGTTSLTDIAPSPLSDTTLTAGAFETRRTTNNRFSYGTGEANQEEVWRQAIDFNGDGRVDIVDAGEQPGAWVVYLNTPGPSGSGVTWVRRVVSTADMVHHMSLRGLDIQGDYLPLARRFTSRDHHDGACLKSNGTVWEDYSAGWGTPVCGSIPQGLRDTGAEETFTEWELIDVNGDGYPDLVFNSSPVSLYPLYPPVRSAGTVINVSLLTKVQPKDGDSNKINAMLNIGGTHLDIGTRLFSAPIDLETKAWCGVALWLEFGDTQHTTCDLADINGDGLPDRIEDTITARLGTGNGFSPVAITLPGPMSVQKSGEVQTCTATPAPPGSTTFFAGQLAGLRDLTGDGIPDYVDGTSGTFMVSIGTGVGFAAAVPIDSAVFSFSGTTERCDGASSLTNSGLFDIDGDGRPDVVALNGGSLDVYQLVGGAQVPRAPEAGRLINVGNGYGATTVVSWRSAKEDGTTTHQVPFAEIVATSTAVSGTAGLGGSLSATRFAYGGASMVFDSAVDAFVFPGYARSVQLQVIDQLFEKIKSRAIITDTYGLDPFSSMPKVERFGRYLRVGRVKDVTTLGGNTPTDPWQLLTVDTAGDPRRIAATHYDWTARLYEEPAIAGTNAIDCIDMMYPYDYATSFDWNLGSYGYDVCSAHGFMYQATTQSWRGSAAPPSTANVATRDDVRDIDDFGRVTSVFHSKDVARSDDDLCVDSQYAVPTGANERVLSALASRKVWNCNRKRSLVYSTERWQYDNLNAGMVSSGFATGHSIDRRAIDSGVVLSTVRAFDATYDAAGNASSIVRTRDDGATRTVSAEYDPFGLAMIHIHVAGSGTPPLDTWQTLDPVSLDALSLTDANLTQRGVVLDGFGRTTERTVTLPGAASAVLWTASYLGFDGTDPLGRRIIGTWFADPVLPGSVATAAGQTNTLYLDELGRQMRAEVALGSDYGGKTVVAGYRRYDGQGRVSFEADPFSSSDDPTAAYGTTYLFNGDGSPSCTVRGPGVQPPTTASNSAAAVFPTCFSRTFSNHTEIVGVSDAAALLAGSPQAGLTTTATLTAVGRVLSRATVRNGARLEYETFDYDRLGHMTGLTRFLDAAGGTKPVRTWWQYDSLGQVLQWKEPEAALQTSSYDNWGELRAVSWLDVTGGQHVARRIVSKYDALGRTVHREEQNNGVPDLASANDYVFDVPSASTPQVTPTYVLGRLAMAKAASGNVSFSYDGYGNVGARVWADPQGVNYIEKSLYHGDGSAAALELYLPDNNYERERVEYVYDSAGRMRAMQYAQAGYGQPLYQVQLIDELGRVRGAKVAATIEYAADYAATGRRLMQGARLSSAGGSHRFEFGNYDPLAREQTRLEYLNNAASGAKTDLTYDALGRLAAQRQVENGSELSYWNYGYDPLGNVTGLNDGLGMAGATLSYDVTDRDRMCRIRYGNGAPNGAACNVSYDGVGNVIKQPTRSGTRRFTYFDSGQVRSIFDGGNKAEIRYDPFGDVQDVDVVGPSSDTRHDRRYGSMIEKREVGGGSRIDRQVSLPNGWSATRLGAQPQWIFSYNDGRGDRSYLDQAGAFVQDVDYQPFGEAKSTGAQPGSASYSSDQWNGGDALAAFGLSQLGARLYDPVIGRFLSRDPLRAVRTAASSNPYAFALNDPWNHSDPTGADPGLPGCEGAECGGGSGGDFPIDNPDDVFSILSSSNQSRSTRPGVPYVAPPVATFDAPRGPVTPAGIALKAKLDDEGIEMGDNFDLDKLMANGNTVDNALANIAETPEAHVAIDASNAKWDRFGSFSAGFGDSVWFWCPGCARVARQQWNIKSGDANWLSYGIGSFTGIVFAFVAPHPTSVVKTPTTTQVLEHEVRNVNAVGGKFNCVNCAIATERTLAGYPASALGGAPKTLLQVEEYFGRAVTDAATAEDVSALARSWGPGSRGIVLGDRAVGIGHAFVVTNMDGMIFFVDGQIAKQASLSGYTSFHVIQVP
jgi:RHS repeat-associated protein